MRLHSRSWKCNSLAFVAIKKSRKIVSNTSYSDWLTLSGSAVAACKLGASHDSLVDNYAVKISPDLYIIEPFNEGASHSFLRLILFVRLGETRSTSY